MAKKYPKTIYMQRQEEGTPDEWMQVQEDPKDFEEDGVIGVYVLDVTKVKRTEVHLD